MCEQIILDLVNRICHSTGNKILLKNNKTKNQTKEKH